MKWFKQIKHFQTRTQAPGRMSRDLLRHKNVRKVIKNRGLGSSIEQDEKQQRFYMIDLCFPIPKWAQPFFGHY